MRAPIFAAWLLLGSCDAQPARSDTNLTYAIEARGDAQARELLELRERIEALERQQEDLQRRLRRVEVTAP